MKKLLSALGSLFCTVSAVSAVSADSVMRRAEIDSFITAGLLH